MAKSRIITAALAATIVTGLVPASAMAQDRYGDGYAGYDRGEQESRWQDDRGGYRHDAYEGGRDYRRQWSSRPDYRRGQDYYDQGGYGRGYYAPAGYRYRCQGSGTTGTIVGGLAGALIGNGVAGHGDRLLGTLLGGGAGALAGRAIDRSGNHC